MTPMQRFFKAVLPAKWAADMEADTRTWSMRCDTCGHAESLWDRGGIRWKGGGRSWTLAPCSTCGRKTRHSIVRP